MVAKQLIVAVFLLGASWAQRAAYDGSTDMAAQCVRNGGPEAYNNVEAAIKKFALCFRSFVDMYELLQDVKEARRLSRSVNEVFKTHCARNAGLSECIRELTESLKPCYKAGELARRNLDVVRNVVNQLLEFTCQEDGAVISSFFAAGGIQCLTQWDLQKPLEGCFDGLQPILPTDSSFIINHVLNINFDERTCGILYKFQKCVVQELKTCSQEVGNIVQSLIRTLRVSTPCKDKPNSASCLTVTMLSSVMAASCLLVM